MLNSGWFEEGKTEYLVPNLLAEAGKDFGMTDDRLRLAISRAALIDGRKILDWDVSLACVKDFVPDIAKLRSRAESTAVLERIRCSTAEFHSLKVTQRPAFVLDDQIGDRVVFSGLWTSSPLLAAIEAMLNDEAAYMSYAAHYGSNP